jgi:hypothetical protein
MTLDSEQIIDTDDDTERLSFELLDELASSQRRATDTRSLEARFSWLKEFAKSPAHARHAALFDRDETLSMRIGDATHSMLFGTKPVVACSHRRRTKARDAFEKAEREKAPNVLIVSPGEHYKASRMADAIKRNKVAERVLFAPGAVIEQTIHWTYKGRKCRATPDARQFRTVADLKTCKSADLKWFARDAAKMFYHSQLGSYRQAIKAETGVLPTEAYIFAVENVAPFVVTPFKLTERALEVGWRLWKGWLDMLLQCEKTNVWDEYTPGVVELDVADDLAEVEIAMRDDDGSRANVDF